MKKIQKSTRYFNFYITKKKEKKFNYSIIFIDFNKRKKCTRFVIYIVLYCVLITKKILY